MFEGFNTMILSKETGARKLFGKEDPMGKVISLKHFWATHDREINIVVTWASTGIIHPIHILAGYYIINMNAMHSIHGEHYNEYLEGTRFGEHMEFFELSYIVLKPGADIRPINGVLNRLANQMMQSDSAGRASGAKFEGFTMKLADIHFDSKNLWENNTHGNKVYLTIFSIIAIMIMVIACIN